MRLNLVLKKFTGVYPTGQVGFPDSASKRDVS
jgi:hypothetical protein